MGGDEDSVRAAYDAVAEAYARHFFDELRHKPLDRALLAAFVEQLPAGGSPVVDVGCGPGHATAHLRDLGVAARGIDLSPVMVEVARRLTPGLDVRVASMLVLDAEDGTLAGIVPCTRSSTWNRRRLSSPSAPLRARRGGTRRAYAIARRPTVAAIPLAPAAKRRTVEHSHRRND